MASAATSGPRAHLKAKGTLLKAKVQRLHRHARTRTLTPDTAQTHHLDTALDTTQAHHLDTAQTPTPDTALAGCAVKGDLGLTAIDARPPSFGFAF